MQNGRKINIGDKFGMLTIVAEADRKTGRGLHRYYVCQCECGNTTIVKCTHLGNGVKSCGCLVNKTNKTRDPLERIFMGMKRRCYSKQTNNYKNYGGKGIIICNEWLNSFKTFKAWALANGYTYDQPIRREDRLSIDRKNPKGNYEPSNCQWIPFSENRARRYNACK